MTSASITLNNTALSNSRQQDTFQNWVPEGEVFESSGMFAMSGNDSSIVLQVLPLSKPLNLKLLEELSQVDRSDLDLHIKQHTDIDPLQNDVY